MKFGKKSAIASKNNNSEPVHNKKYLKTEIKSYKGRINIKEGSQCICISVILTDSVYRKNKNYYPEVFLQKHRYAVNEIKNA